MVWIAALSGYGCTSDLQPTDMNAPDVHVRKAGYLQDPALKEASGMAFSAVETDLLWLVNDSGDQPVLYAVGTDGTARGRVTVTDAVNQDWEDLASFRLQQTPYLLIADVGDNQARRPAVWLYIVKEPPTREGTFDPASQVKWVQKIQFTYEDGPRDCEAVAVDSAGRKILLLTKRDRPPRLYHLPLDLAVRTPTRVARFIATIETIPPPTFADLREDPRFGRFRSQPTAMDLSPDGRLVVVQTYKHAYLYRKAADIGWSEAFAAQPALLLVPRMPQIEAACFGLARNSLYVTTEKQPAPLYYVTIPKGVRP